MAVRPPRTIDHRHLGVGDRHRGDSDRHPGESRGPSGAAWIPAFAGTLVALLAGAVLVASAALAEPANPAKAAEPPPGAAACTGCHTASPAVVSPGPVLVGGEPKAMLAALDEFRSGKRPATVMDRIVRGFTPDELQAIVAWFAARK